jgi:hypothetical protein
MFLGIKMLEGRLEIQKMQTGWPQEADGPAAREITAPSPRVSAAKGGHAV